MCYVCVFFPLGIQKINWKVHVFLGRKYLRPAVVPSRQVKGHKAECVNPRTLGSQEWAGNATSPGAKVGRKGSQVRAGCDDLRAKRVEQEGAGRGQSRAAPEQGMGFKTTHNKGVHLNALHNILIFYSFLCAPECIFAPHTCKNPPSLVKLGN